MRFFVDRLIGCRALGNRPVFLVLALCSPRYDYPRPKANSPVSVRKRVKFTSEPLALRGRLHLAGGL